MPTKKTAPLAIDTTGKRLVVTREAARFLGLSPRRVTTLAQEGVIWSAKAGPLNIVYDLDDLERYKRARDRARDEGKVRGAVPQGKATTRVVTAPVGRTLVLTREAAKVLGCSMRHVRVLARTGKLYATKLGPASEAFDLDELRTYRATMEAARKAGTARGRKPRGFKPDPQPPVS